MSGEFVEFSRSVKQHSPVTPQRVALLWLLFFVICLGLGYPPLNRYDPGRLAGTGDVAEYRDIVVGRAPQPASGAIGAFARLAHSEHYYRVLVPYVARPFYWLARGHVRTWDAALLGLLMANAIFMATTACLLVAIARRLTLDAPTALLGATLYLLNFCVANFILVGLVDSAECCFVMIIVWSLLTGRWFLLPIWGVFGALAKETFAPLSALFVFGWWIAEVRRKHLQLPRLGWAIALGVASITTVTIAMTAVAGGLVWPWQFAAYMRGDAGFLAGLRACVLDHTFWYIFIWLLPLGIPRLLHLPRPWVQATGVAVFGTLAIGAYHNMGDTARPLFNIAGPILSLSAAIFLTGPKGASDAHPTAPQDDAH